MNQVKGILCLDKNIHSEPAYKIIWCKNVILQQADQLACITTVCIPFRKPAPQVWHLKLVLLGKT